jgi:ankyrin repeat protein
MKDLNKKLISAIYQGKERKVQRLLKKGADTNFKDEDGRPPLMLAILAEYASPKVVRLLIENGADVNTKDFGQKWSALHFAARDGRREIVQILLGSGAEVDSQNIFGNTPLMEALHRFRGDPAIIETLLRNGADKNIENNYGISPMSLAEEGRDQTRVNILKQVDGH